MKLERTVGVFKRLAAFRFAIKSHVKDTAINVRFYWAEVESARSTNAVCQYQQHRNQKT